MHIDNRVNCFSVLPTATEAWNPFGRKTSWIRFVMIINCIIFASNSSNQLDPNGLFHIQGSVIFQTVKQIAIHTFSHLTRRIRRARDSAHVRVRQSSNWFPWLLPAHWNRRKPRISFKYQQRSTCSAAVTLSCVFRKTLFTYSYWQFLGRFINGRISLTMDWVRLYEIKRMCINDIIIFNFFGFLSIPKE